MKNRKHKLLNLGLLLTASGVVIHLINRTVASSSQVKNLLRSSSGGNYFDWRFGKVFYSVQGSGDPLLLLHDLTPGSSSYEWNSVVETLAKTRTVYCIDLPGCGRSARPKMTYTNFLYVQLINDFIRKIIGKPTDIIATGLSTSFVVTAAKMETANFGKLMFVNPKDLAKLNQLPTGRSKVLKCCLELPVIGTLLYNILTSRNNTELAFTENYLYNPFHLNTADTETYYEASHRCNSNGKYLLASMAGNYTNFNIAHALRELDHEILIVGGSNEPGIRETCALYASLNSSVKYVTLNHTKHLPQLEIPVDFLKHVRDFF